MIEKKHLKHVAHGGRVGLGVANSWVGLNEVYAKTAILNSKHMSPKKHLSLARKLLILNS